MNDISAVSTDVLTLTLTPDNPTNTSITNADGDVLYTVVTDYTKKSTWTQVRDANDDVIGSLEWRGVLADRVRIGNNKPMSLWDWMKKSPVPFKNQAAFVDDEGRKYKWKGLLPGLSLQLYCEDDNFASPIAKYARSRTLYISPGPFPPLDGASPPASPISPSTISFSPTLTDKDVDTASIAPTLASVDAPSIASTLVERNSSRTTLSSPTRITKRLTPATFALSPRATQIQDLVILSFLFLEKYHRTKESNGVSNSSTFTGYMGMHGC